MEKDILKNSYFCEFMKSLVQKSGAFTMAFLVLFSTMSFAVEKHFCGKILVDMAVFSETQSCCSDTSHDNTEKDSCCKNQTLTFEGQNELKVSFHQLDFQQHVFLATFTYSYLNFFEGLHQKNIPFKYYSPPLLVSNILVLHQVFLI